MKKCKDCGNFRDNCVCKEFGAADVEDFAKFCEANKRHYSRPKRKPKVFRGPFERLNDCGVSITRASDDFW